MAAELGRAAQRDARLEGLGGLVVEEQVDLPVAERLEHGRRDALQHLVEVERGAQLVAQAQQRFEGRRAFGELGGELRAALVEARVVDHEGGEAGDRLPHADALVVEVGLAAGLVEHGDAEQLALGDERQGEDLAGVEGGELGFVDPRAVGRHDQRLAQVAQPVAHVPPSVAERGDEGGPRRGGEAQMVALDQQDGAARHAHRGGELLCHRAEQVVQVERSGEVGGDAAEHAGRRREARQGVLHAGGRPVAQGEHDGQGADGGEGKDGRVDVGAALEGQEAEEGKEPGKRGEHRLAPRSSRAAASTGSA